MTREEEREVEEINLDFLCGIATITSDKEKNPTKVAHFCDKQLHMGKTFVKCVVG